MYCSENLAINGVHEDGSFPRFRRFTIRKDGFVSVRAEKEEGEVITKAMIVRGDKLTINYDATLHDGGSVSVEILDAERRPVPGFNLKKCDALTGDKIDQLVTWDGSEDLKFISGKPIHLRFVMKGADLFSFKFINPDQA